MYFSAPDSYANMKRLRFSIQECKWLGSCALSSKNQINTRISNARSIDFVVSEDSTFECHHQKNIWIVVRPKTKNQYEPNKPLTCTNFLVFPCAQQWAAVPHPERDGLLHKFGRMMLKKRERERNWPRRLALIAELEPEGRHAEQ